MTIKGTLASAGAWCWLSRVKSLAMGTQTLNIVIEMYGPVEKNLLLRDISPKLVLTKYEKNTQTVGNTTVSDQTIKLK